MLRDGPSMFEMKKRIELADMGMAAIIQAFLAEGFVQGKATVKSEDPVDDSGKDLKVIVGTTFEERVINSDESAFIEFYAPWCGACKELAPKFEKVATALKGEALLVAKMDVTANGIDAKYGLDIKSFPQVYFFPALDKLKPVQYSGPKEVEPMVKFLQLEIDDEDPGEDEL